MAARRQGGLQIVMKIVVVGGTTSLGQHLVRALCASAVVDQGRAPAEPILSLDVVRPGAARLFVDDRVGYVTGDPATPAWLSHVMGVDTSSVFVLAPALLRDDADAELRATVDAVRALLEACRARAGGLAGIAPPPGFPVRAAPRFVLVCSESLSAGADSMQVQRTRRIEIARLLVADYSDRGHVDGRIVDLPSVVVDAPGAVGLPPAGIGTWLGWAIGESVAGRRVSCPRSTQPWALVSAPAAVRAIIAAHEQPATRWTPIASRARRVAAIQSTATDWLSAVQAVAPAEIAGRWSLAGEAGIDLQVSAQVESADPLPGDGDLVALVRASMACVMDSTGARPQEHGA